MMEPQIIVRDYGVCRCCAAVGNHRDITKEYYHNGIREVFLDIFIECFNLYLSRNKHLSMLICSSCVTRLREASSFKMLVMSTEQQLLAAISNSDQNTIPYINVIKQELITEANGTDVGIDEEPNIDEDKEFICDMQCSNESDSEKLEVVEGETELLARFNHKYLTPLPTRRTLLGYCPIYVKYLDSLKDKVMTPKKIEKLFLKKPKPSKIYVSEKLANTINACTLFECSNATAFKTKTKSGFPCFYCREIFESMDLLREHQLSHTKSSLFKLLSKYTADALVVYADVTDLKCTICGKDVPSLSELKAHLMTVHDKKMYPEFEDRVIPFKINGESDFECQICRFNFETFGAIERHMNIHFGNSICEQCGAGFVTISRLKIHIQMVHRQGSYPCTVCKKVYKSFIKYKIHADTVHNMQRKNKCPKCPERFIDYFTRRKHLVEKHGVAPIVYRCKVCDRGFSRRFSLSGHVKRCHLAQKDIQCEFCPYMCLTKGELSAHMLKHTGEKTHECSVCKKTFARLKTLKEHAKIHENNEYVEKE